MNPFLWIPLLALLSSVALHAIAVKLFPKLGLLDFPERYGLSRPKLPYPTGIVSILLFLIFFATFYVWEKELFGITSAVVILGIFCFIDDRTPLSTILRILVHVLIAIIIFLNGAQIYSFTNPLEGVIGGTILPLDTMHLALPLLGTIPLLSAIFTIVWLGLTINALNWFDGIPGQVSTISTIGFLTIGFLSLSSRVNQPTLALLAFILAAISLGTLVFDFPPRRMLIGDTGAMFFGLMLGVLTISSGGKVATAFLVLGVPLLDLVLVVAQRIFKGKSIFKGDSKSEHLHHRLLAKGWTERQIILLTACIGTIFGTTALFLDTFEKFIAALLLFSVMLMLSLYSRPKAKVSSRAL